MTSTETAPLFVVADGGSLDVSLDVVKSTFNTEGSINDRLSWLTTDGSKVMFLFVGGPPQVPSARHGGGSNDGVSSATWLFGVVVVVVVGDAVEVEAAGVAVVGSSVVGAWVGVAVAVAVGSRVRVRVTGVGCGVD
ncbi:hypothetical protein [Halogranum gelatinilyticum]|uniref:hypothetical protein n=1 Tax=Halogranum gelatinilyticum TaxID=660521 RepID=UPI001481C9E3|nr:hypothetical protein [Halogranum gelatinilyticum]